MLTELTKKILKRYIDKADKRSQSAYDKIEAGTYKGKDLRDFNNKEEGLDRAKRRMKGYMFVKKAKEFKRDIKNYKG